MAKTKTAPAGSLDLSRFPNFSANGSITGMKKQYYGKDALLIRQGSYIYNVSSEPDIYNNLQEQQPRPRRRR